MEKVSFDRIVGQSRPKAILKSAIAAGRIAHAYLFHGEPHIGKRTTALAFAKAALCRQGLSDTPSGNLEIGIPSKSCKGCSSCQAVEAGNHPDIFPVQPDGSQIKIGQIRRLREAISYKPLIGSRKWFIMEEADTLNPEAANAFLKTLEEPPDHSILVLITARPHLLLPTIRSRCQGIRFDLPPQAEIIKWLQAHRGMNPEEAKSLAMLSLGRIGIAAEADPASLKSERDRLIEAFSSQRLKEPADLFSVPEEFATREELYKTLDSIEIWLRDILISQHSPDQTLLIHPDLADRTHRWGQEIGSEGILDTLSLIHVLKRAAPRNLNPVLVLETVLLNLRDIMIPQPDPAGDRAIASPRGRR